MRTVNFPYICKNMAGLSGFPIRHYKNNILHGFYSVVPFPLDPVNLYLETLLTAENSVSYYITPYNMYFGIIKQKENCIIIGPVAYFTLSNNTLREITFLLGANDKDTTTLKNSMQSVPIMGPQNFIYFLAMVNYYVNNEIISVQDIIFYNALSDIPYEKANDDFLSPSKVPNDFVDQLPTVHNFFSYEQKMLSMVRNGDTQGLIDLIANNTLGNTGKNADSYINQIKNDFISAVTLISRSAIQGGVSIEEALSLSDNYILRVGRIHNINNIMSLFYEMIMNFTNRVNDVKSNKLDSTFVRNICGYINSHITEAINIEQISSVLNYNRSYMTTRFKKETGQKLSSYILSEKIKKAKHLLITTDFSIMDISSYLSFSSQSHFQNVFKKIEGVTPNQYRKKNISKNSPLVLLRWAVYFIQAIF